MTFALCHEDFDQRVLWWRGYLNVGHLWFEKERLFVDRDSRYQLELRPLLVHHRRPNEDVSCPGGDLGLPWIYCVALNVPSSVQI